MMKIYRYIFCYLVLVLIPIGVSAQSDTSAIMHADSLTTDSSVLHDNIFDNKTEQRRAMIMAESEEFRQFLLYKLEGLNKHLNKHKEVQIADSLITVLKNKGITYVDTAALFIDTHTYSILDSIKRFEDNFYDTDIEDIDDIKASKCESELHTELNMLTNSSTQVDLSIRNAPSVITVITDAQIKALGARDIMDVLRLVPGFHVALGEAGNLGIGVRGNWANDGKVLLLLDGQEMNDIYSAQLTINKRFPVDFIKRIEVIRGPGSINYGGFAEFAVINIVTYSPGEMNGLSVGYSTGQTSKMHTSDLFKISYGKKWTKAALSVWYYGGIAQQSDANYFGFFPMTEWVNSGAGIGKYASLKGNSDVLPSLSNVLFTYNNFSIRTITDFLNVQDISKISKDGSRPVRVGNKMNFTEMSYKWKISEHFSFTPKLNTVSQYTETNNDELYDESTNFTSRIKIGGVLQYDNSVRSSHMIGSEYFIDYYTQAFDMLSPVNEIKDLNYRNLSAYYQTIQKFPLVNITFGLRYDQNSAYGSSLAPRIGFTRKFAEWHFKVLFNRAFRAPSAGNIAQSYTENYIVNGDTSEILWMERKLKPEKTTVVEFELGRQLTKNVMLTANIFYIHTRNPIVYSLNQSQLMLNIFEQKNRTDAMALPGYRFYTNFDESGSSGLELQFIGRYSWGTFDANYSFNTVAGHKVPMDYKVTTFSYDPENRKTISDWNVLAFPMHSGSLNFTLYLTKKFSFNINSKYFGERYGFTLVQYPDVKDIDGNVILPEKLNIYGVHQKFSSTWVTNLFLGYQGEKGLELGFGVNNTQNRKYEYIQPYFGLNQTLPALSREFFIKAAWHFGGNPHWRGGQK